MEKTDKSVYWSKIIKTWKESGLKQREFCAKHQINIHTFVYWKQKIDGKSSLFAPVNVEAAKRFAPVFYKLETPLGVKLYIPSGAKADELNVLFKALGIAA